MLFVPVTIQYVPIAPPWAPTLLHKPFFAAYPNFPKLIPNRF